MPNKCGALLCLALLCASRLDARTPSPAGPPTVLVLVAAGQNGQDQVGLTYRGQVPHAQAKRDMAALQAATGWRVTNIEITDLPPPVAGAKGKMTGLTCTAAGAVAPQSHTFDIAPIIGALRPYKRIALTYFAPPDFAFQGLRAYADNHVEIALEQRGITYTYQIQVRDPHFGRLDLPRYQLTDLQARAAQAADTKRRRARPWAIALVLAAALGAGGLVYAALARHA